MGKSQSKENQVNKETLEETLHDDPMDLIQRNYIMLLEHLDSEQIIDRLFQNFTLTTAENEELMYVEGARRKAKILVIKLRTKSKIQIRQFIEIIKDIQPFLYNMLLSNSLHAMGPRFGWLDNAKQDCEPCKEQDKCMVATDWCYQCCEAMCQSCAEIHKRMKLLKHHSIKKFTELQCKEETASTPISVDHSTKDILKLSQGHNMPLHIKGDKENSVGATDLVHMTIEGISILLVTDWHNQCIKSFTEIQTKVKCKRLNMAACPFRMTRVLTDQIAVTMSNSSLITIVKVGIGVLEVSKVIKAKKQYDGITYIGNGKFAVSGQTLDIIDINGEILQTIDSSIFNDRPLCNPDYLTHSPTGDIIISDTRNRQIICLSQNGNIVWVYQSQSNLNLECPHGVYCDNTGNVFIADWDLHTITMLSANGKFRQIVASAKDRLYRPRAVYVDEKCERLFVIQDGNFARTFRFRKD